MTAEAWGVAAFQLMLAVIAFLGAAAGYLRLRAGVLDAQEQSRRAAKISSRTDGKVDAVQELVNGSHSALLEEVRSLKAQLEMSRAKEGQK
jgi:hypothetical protein